MQFQWYPGHMTKAKRQMQEDIKLIDLVIELVDARIPLSSRNPDIDELGKNKARLILMNKSDLADEEAGKLWSAYFQKKGYYVVSLDSRNRNGMKQVTAVVMEACKEKIERDRKRGIMNRPVRAMVVGIPNVGKSTFINSYAGKACAKTGNKPGVTKGKQWIRLNKNVLMLPKWNSLTAMWYLKVSLTVRRRRSPTIFLWYWAMMWDAPGSPSMISGENYTTSTSMWESPILLHCTPLPAGEPKWQASEISPVHWNPVNARI